MNWQKLNKEVPLNHKGEGDDWWWVGGGGLLYGKKVLEGKSSKQSGLLSAVGTFK